MIRRIICSFLVVLTLLFGVKSYAQKISANKITYNYYRQPAAASLVKRIRNYQVVVDNGTAMPEEMADVNKNVGALLSGRNRNPSRPPSDEPEHITTEAANELADVYIGLKGHKRNDANALKIVVIPYSFEHSRPNIVPERQTNINIGSGTSYTYDDMRYHDEFSYRYPIEVNVFTPDGQKVLSFSALSLSDYKLYQSYPKTNPSEIDTKMLLENARDKALRDNLNQINKQLNYALADMKRVGTLYRIENWSGIDIDLNRAYNEASSGLQLLQQNYTTAKVKLNEADSLFTAALREGNMNTRIAKALCFNLLEVNFAAGDLDRATLVLNKLDSYTLSDEERKARNELDVLITDRKIHQQGIQQP